MDAPALLTLTASGPAWQVQCVPLSLSIGAEPVFEGFSD